jgi:hypothetical protein
MRSEDEFVERILMARWLRQFIKRKRMEVKGMKNAAIKESLLSLLGSDVLAPEQFAETFRRKEYLEPEKALLLAVLEDAINCFIEYHAAEDRVGKGRFQEAEEWIMHTGNDWFFSYDNVCELLGLNPEYLRQGLRQCSTKKIRREKSPRQGLRRHAA